MKSSYGIPEIWFAERDREAMEETAVGLREAGLSTVLAQGDDLAEIPGQVPPCPPS